MSARSADDWVRAAFTLLARKGAEFVRVEPLAKQLAVTKGSFYWHFEDRAALLQAMLTEWERVATSNIIELVERRGGVALERLRRLLLTTTAPAEAARVEQAIRAWGASEGAVREALERVDARREAYVRDLLIGCGVGESKAAHRSHALYRMLIGEYAQVSHGGEPTSRAVWEEMLSLMTRP